MLTFEKHFFHCVSLFEVKWNEWIYLYFWMIVPITWTIYSGEVDQDFEKPNSMYTNKPLDIQYNKFQRLSI